MDKKPEKLVPEIRFKGFTDDWEQRKLGEVAEFYNGDRGPNYPKPSEIVEQGVPFINAGDLINGHIDYHNCKHITSDKFNQLNGAKLKINDIVYCIRGTIGKNGLVNSDANATIASSLVCIRPVKLRPLFLFQILNSSIEERQRKMVDEGAAQPNISATNLKKFLIPVPNDNEQEKIGEVFSKLNHLITLQQRKLEQLKQLKKAMLQQLFVDKNNKQPILKFKNFRNNWREYKLGEIVNLEDNKRKPVKATERMRGEIPYYGANGIQDYVKGYTHIGKHVLIAEDGANSVDDYPIYFISSPSWINNHTHVLTAKQEILSSEFLSYALKKINYAKYLVGSGRYKLNAEILKLIPLQIPTMNEQKNIEINLSKIDKLISLQQNKLTQLTTLKKYLLQKMFI